MKLLVKYNNIELHSFNAFTTKEKKPFVSVIEKEEIQIL
jgi:hypothetical protein